MLSDTGDVMWARTDKHHSILSALKNHFFPQTVGAQHKAPPIFPAVIRIHFPKLCLFGVFFFFPCCKQLENEHG